MARRANPARVGAFVLGAVALAVVAIIVLSSGRLFHKTHKYVLFFTGDVNGLRVGAAVKFKGVQIGTVTGILLDFNLGSGHTMKTSAIVIPVMIEIDQQRLASHGAAAIDLNDPDFMRQAIQGGLRAQLGMESLLTGLLYVNLDVLPETPANFVMPPQSNLSDYQEIPTLPTTLEEAQSALARVLAELDKVDFPKLVGSATQTLASVKDLVTSPSLKASIDHLSVTEGKLDSTADSIQALSGKVGAEVGPLTDRLKEDSRAANATLKQANLTISKLGTTLEPESPLVYQTDQALQNVSAAAIAVRELAEYLQRNPDAIVRGRVYQRDRR